MCFVRGSLPTFEEVQEKLIKKGCEIQTYEMNVVGPYGALKEVTCIVNKDTYEYFPIFIDKTERVTTAVLENMERLLNIKLLQPNVISIEVKKKK